MEVYSILFAVFFFPVMEYRHVTPKLVQQVEEAPLWACFM